MDLPKYKCPATGFARTCAEIIADSGCPKFVTIRGTDPQGGMIDKSGCVDSFLPALLLENSQQTRQAGAAVESLRNEIVRMDEEKFSRLSNVLGAVTANRLMGRE